MCSPAAAAAGARGDASQEEAVVDERLGSDVPLGELAPREAHGEVDEVGGEDGDEGVHVEHVEEAVGEHREDHQVVLAARLRGETRQNERRLWAGTEVSQRPHRRQLRGEGSPPQSRVALSERVGVWICGWPDGAAASQGTSSVLAGEQQFLEAAGGVLKEDRLARVAQLGRQAEQPLVVLLPPDLELVRLGVRGQGWG